MQRTLNRWRVSGKCSAIYFMLSLLLLLFSGRVAFAQNQAERVTFFSADSLLISADSYIVSDTLPFLVLLHEQGSSRGEFNAIIDRFQKMNYNCLNVDLRNGGTANYASNETVRWARKGDYSMDVGSVEGDILAAIGFVVRDSSDRVVLLGSGANGSLALKIAKELPSVKGAIALSPGEYFRPAINIEDTIAGLQKPVLITSTASEYPYLEQLVSGIEPQYKKVFKPESDPGKRGTAALLPDCKSNGEYWLAMLLFFKELK